MNYAMIVLLPCDAVEAFKDDLRVLSPEATCYKALTSDIQCREEALAVIFPDNDADKLAIYELLASSGYKLLLPLQLKTIKQETDKVCVFDFPFRSRNSDDNLLQMWEFCTRAMDSLPVSARKLVRYAIYVNADQVVTFQASFCLGDDFSAWQKAVTDFYLSLIRETGRRLHIEFDSCQLYTNSR